MANLKDVVGQIQRDEEPITFPVKQRDGLPYLAADGKTPATITVLGSESTTLRAKRDAEYRAMAEEGQNPRIESLEKRQAAGEPLTDGEQAELYADSVARRARLAAVAVVGWSGWEDGTEPIDSTPANVRALLSVEHILYQVEAKVNTGAGFFGAGLTG